MGASHKGCWIRTGTTWRAYGERERRRSIEAAFRSGGWVQVEDLEHDLEMSDGAELEISEDEGYERGMVICRWRMILRYAGTHQREEWRRRNGGVGGGRGEGRMPHQHTFIRLSF